MLLTCAINSICEPKKVLDRLDLPNPENYVLFQCDERTKQLKLLTRKFDTRKIESISSLFYCFSKRKFTHLSHCAQNGPILRLQLYHDQAMGNQNSRRTKTYVPDQDMIEVYDSTIPNSRELLLYANDLAAKQGFQFMISELPNRDYCRLVCTSQTRDKQWCSVYVLYRLGDCAFAGNFQHAHDLVNFLI